MIYIKIVENRIWNDYYLRALTCIFSLFLSSCFDNTSSQSVIPVTPSSVFSGASSAQNLSASGSTIRVSWGAASSPYVSYTIFLSSNGTLTPIQSNLSISQTSFDHFGLTSGNLYTYVVQAFDALGNSDGNLNTVSALAYAGVNQTSGYGSLTTSGATLQFPAGGANSQGVHIYCSMNNKNAYNLVATVSNNAATSQAISTLYSGTNYSCRVNAISSITGQDDFNRATVSFQTLSVGFTQASPAYQGVILVQGYGDAPSAPTAATAPAYVAASNQGIINPATVPTTRQINITWKNFAVGSPASAAYRLSRVVQGGTFDMNVSTPCTANLTTSCQVCLSTTQSTSLSRMCQDTAIGASPTRYEYAVSLIVDPTTTPPLAEQLPSSPNDAPFRILVPVPPSNMTLVHRDSVNYEICSLMNIATDPLNHQRCSYSGLGAVPLCSFANNTCVPLNLPMTYYDFGYNLFVDRFGVGCNWTPASAGGMCGTGGTSGDCWGPSGSNPPSSIGVSGNVYYRPSDGHCWVKNGSVWNYTNSNLLSSSDFQKIVTNAPNLSAQRPPLTQVNPNNALSVCQAMVDPYYGPKRLIRRREYIAAAGFSWVPGEVGYQSLPAIASLQNGVSLSATQACNSNGGNGVGGSNSGTFNTPYQRAVSGGYNDFIIGSHYTAQCVSRYGIQDLIGNNGTMTSDQFVCTGGSICTFITSPLDHGNQDFSFVEAYNFDGITGPGGTSAGQSAPYYTTSWSLINKSYGANYFSVPLGVPFVSNDHGNALAIGTGINSNQLNNNNFNVNTYQNGIIYTGTNDSNGGSACGRFNMNNNGGYYNQTPRCVVPAE